jgi:arylsulfatase A-like enzyme
VVRGERLALFGNQEGSGRETTAFMTPTSKAFPLGCVLLLGLVLLPLPACREGVREEMPSLVVLVVVDQLRADLLDRYDGVFTGGIRRLLDEGFQFSNTVHDHGNASTAGGHAAIATGTHPSRNGMVGSEWLEHTATGWRSVHAVDDSLTHILGLPALPGRSPRNILRDGLGDWIAAVDSGAVVFAASRKAESAIILAGRTRGQAYWITENEGQFATSGFYAEAYPGWIDRFNREEMPRIFGDSVWLQTIPTRARNLTRRDTVEYEGDGIHTHFPHRFHDEVEDPHRPGALNRWAYRRSHPDAAVGAIAMEAVRALRLGQGPVPHLLALSFSQTDAVGKMYGPLSREQLENLLHLDAVLGDLMTFLDRAVGDGRWVMAFTGDHGVLTMPEYLTEQGGEGLRGTPEQLASLARTFDAFRQEEGYPAERADSLARTLLGLPFVADALTLPELSGGPPPDSFVVLMRNSHHPDRWIGFPGSEGLGVVLRFKENFLPSFLPQGTGYGSPYLYDRHVPLVFYGAGVPTGVSSDPVRTVDVAPTLARLAGIPIPTDLDGRPLLH